MSRKANDLLVELQNLGLTDGVSTTVKGKQVTLNAGSLSASATDDDPDIALEKAVESLLGKVKAKPAKDRPKAWEATTRTVADADPNNPDGERTERHVTAEDF